MKNQFLIILLCLTCFIKTFGQSEKISVGKLKNGGVFIEVGYKSVYLTSQANQNLQNALTKAINWANTNEKYKDEFEKELLRLRTTDKETFLFYKKYISQFTEEGKLTFKGFSDGTFEVLFEGDIYFKLESIEDMRNIIKLLQGKTINNTINDRYK